jgi:phosphopantothenoylcysteine decarboxylase/phosphopantothenate--cysteine ligase
VILVSGPSSVNVPEGVELVPVVTAEEMHSAVMKRLSEASIVVMAAAVSDYRVREVAAQKLRREGAGSPKTLELVPTEDILRGIVDRRRAGTFVLGFAAETEDVLANGRAKLERKGVDALVVNDVSGTETGFDADCNAGSFLTPEDAVALPKMPKTEMAERILDEVVRLRATREHGVETRA